MRNRRRNGESCDETVQWILSNRVSIDDHGCWIWNGKSLNKGYGTVRYAGSNHGAHRLVKIALHGAPHDPNLLADHICRVRSCVNPDHIRWVTQKQNVTENSDSPAARAAALETCPKCGGEYHRSRRGHRICRSCTAKYQKAYDLVYRAKKKAGLIQPGSAGRFQ